LVAYVDSLIPLKSMKGYCSCLITYYQAFNQYFTTEGYTLAKVLNFTDENPVRHLIFWVGWLQIEVNYLCYV